MKMKLFRFFSLLLFLICALLSCSSTRFMANAPKDGCFPLPGAKVISHYHNNRGGHRHTGVDLKTKPNDPIYAVFDGVVTMSKSYYGYGNCIIIRHDNGMETLYSHNSKNLVKEGERVKCGQQIALTGRTGRATTEHLHFELRKNGKPQNPTALLDKLQENMNRR